MKYATSLLIVLLSFTGCKSQKAPEAPSSNLSSGDSQLPAPNPIPAPDRSGPYRPDVALVLNPNSFFRQDKRFAYAPSVIQKSGSDALEIFTCHNPANGTYDDAIYLSQVMPQKNGDFQVNTSFSFYPGNRPNDWNACDPTTVQGEFRFKGKTYNHAIFYTAMPYERFLAITSSPPPKNSSEYNEVRLLLYSSARNDFAFYGSFFNFPRQSDDTFSYGFGQPSVISLDQKGKLLLFYTHGRTKNTTSDWHTKYRILDIANVDSPVVGPQQMLSSRSIIPITNGDYALGPGNKLYVITEDPTKWIEGIKVASGLRLLSMTVNPNDLNTSLQTETWKIEKTIQKNDTNQSLNHNAGLIRNEFGRITDINNIGIIFTGGDSLAKPIEWTYKLYATYINLINDVAEQPAPQPPKLDPVISWNTYANAQSYWVDISVYPDFRWFWNCATSTINISWSQCQSKKYPGFNNPPDMPTTADPKTKYYYRIVPVVNGVNKEVHASGSF